MTKLGGEETVKSSERLSRFTALIYGQSGIGKTTLAASAAEVPEMSPVLFLDIEDGQESVKGLYDVESIRCTSLKKMQRIYDDLKKPDHGYKTVVIDNITELQQFGMAQMMGETEEWDDPSTPDWPMYNRSTEQMRRFIRGFRDLTGMNIIFTAHETTAEDPRTKRDVARPYLTNKASQQAPGFLNSVLYYFSKKDKRVLLTTKNSDAVAKDRSRKLPPEIENPTMSIIWDYYQGNLVYTPEEKEASAASTSTKRVTRK